jgi:predicted neuraminidase
MIHLIFALTVCAAEPAPFHEVESIFVPNPKHNHGSSIVETPQGDLLACWFHGSGERKSDDVLIQGARKRKGEAAWSAPFVMADSQNLPDCNPVLFVDPRGTLWLTWIAVQNNMWGGSLLKYRTATEYGADGPPAWDWQDVIHCRPPRFEELYEAYIAKAEVAFADLIASDEQLAEDVAQLKVVVKQKLDRRLGWMTRLHPIMLSDTRMMLGLYSDVFNCSLAAFTEDWGKTWTFSEPIFGIGNIQPSFVVKKNGDVYAMMRDNGPFGFIQVADSTDGGVRWTPARTISIPNPGSSVECIVMKNGHWVLVCNDTKDGRHQLTAYLSEDEGASWKWSRPLEDHEKDAGSASYPSVIQAADDAIHCTYSFREDAVKGSTIRHTRFNEGWIRQGVAAP